MLKIRTPFPLEDLEALLSPIQRPYLRERTVSKEEDQRRLLARTVKLMDRVIQVSAESPSGCITGVRPSTCPYPRVNIQGKGVRLSRLVFTLCTGPVPVGMDVLHQCDNPSCYKPSHLFLGTDVDNVRDKLAKGRGNNPRGEMVNTAKLTAEKVITIRGELATGASIRSLAKSYGVSRTAIKYIKTKRNWKHL